MKRSTTKNKLPLFLNILISAVFWTALWAFLAYLVDQELLLPSPAATLKRLIVLAGTSEFRSAAGMTLLRVLVGYLSGILAGTLLAVLTAASRPLNTLFSPLGTIIRATPVASFIILALVWIKASNVPSFISFLMVTPIVWSSLRTAILNTDPALLEAASAYRLGRLRTLRMVYLPAVLPQYAAAMITSLGLAWKSGVAAEVLCHPRLGIGTMLHESQIYLETADLFAWTATVILLSVAMEKCFGLLLKKLTEGRNPS